jgi:hypothetical protein
MGGKNDTHRSTAGSFAERTVRGLMAFPMFLLKAVYILPFLLFGLWLLQLLYFPQFDVKNLFAVTSEKIESKTPLQPDDSVPRGHFHMIDAFISQPEIKPPFCLRCHGTYPHSKEKKVRAMLNSHTGFIACSVCHARKEPGDKTISFVWIDHETGEIVAKAEGEYGKYSAKIFPVQITPQGQKRIFRPIDDQAAQQYILFKDEYSPDQVAIAKKKLHEHLSAKPVFCSDCHQKEGYLDFSKLNFPLNRVNHLNSSEVVGMIEKYKTFYLPSEIDFGQEKTFNK